MIDEYLEKWLAKAGNDLKAAESLINQEPEDMVTDAICFHSQQAVEKYLKRSEREPGDCQEYQGIRL